MSFFTTPQEQMMTKLRVIKQIVGEQELRDSPCPLLISQLEELKVFVSKLTELTGQMLTEMKGLVK